MGTGVKRLTCDSWPMGTRRGHIRADKDLIQGCSDIAQLSKSTCEETRERLDLTLLARDWLMTMSFVLDCCHWGSGVYSELEQ